MKYSHIAYVKNPVSHILAGTASPPFSTGGDGNALLDAFFDLGVTAFDTARVYGRSEEVIGRWMEERGLREHVTILSKCAHPDELTGRKRLNEKEIREDFAVSSGLLRTDYIDIYLAHRDDPEKPAGEIVEIFNALHAEGKIGAFGGSNWTHARIEEAGEYAYRHNLIPFTVSSPNFGLASQVKDLWGGGCVTISGPENQEARDWYRANQMPVIAYSSLGRGLFSGRVKSGEPEKAAEILDEFALKGYAYPVNFEKLRRCEEVAAERGCSVPQIAMAWLFGQPVHTFAVVSASSRERMQANIEAMEIALTEGELRYLELEAESPD